MNHSEDACRKEEFVLQGSSCNWLQFLHIAAENGNESIVVECLLSHLREVKKKKGVEVIMPAILDHHRRTVLHCACLGLQLDVVRLLLGYTVPVRFFGWGTRIETLTFILASCEEYGGTLTGRRVCNNGDPVYDIRLPRSLTFHPHDFSSGSMTDNFGNTALLCASSTALDYDFSNNKNALATSAPQNAVSNNGVYVNLSVKASILKLLMGIGDSPTHRNPLTGWTPLHWAAYFGDVEGCCILIGAIDPDFFSPPESTTCAVFVHDILDSKVSAVTKGLYTAHENVIGKWLRLRVDLIDDDLKDVDEWKEGVILDCRSASTSGSMVMEHLVGFPRCRGNNVSRQGWYCLVNKELVWVTKADGTCPLLHSHRVKRGSTDETRPDVVGAVVRPQQDVSLRQSYLIVSEKALLPIDIACLQAIRRDFHFAPPRWRSDEDGTLCHRKQHNPSLQNLPPNRTTPWTLSLEDIHLEVSLWWRAGHWPRNVTRNGQSSVYVALWMLEDAARAFQKMPISEGEDVDFRSENKAHNTTRHHRGNTVWQHHEHGGGMHEESVWLKYRDHALYWSCFFGISSQVRAISSTPKVDFLCQCTGHADGKVQSPLHSAAGRNNVEVVRYIIAHLRAACGKKQRSDGHGIAGDDGGKDHLHSDAVMTTTTTMMMDESFLVSHPGWFNSNHETPLHVAALHGAHETTVYLMSVVPQGAWQRFDDDGWLVSDLHLRSTSNGTDVHTRYFQLYY